MVAFILPGIITEQACQEMTRALAKIQSLRQSKDLAISHHREHAGQNDD